MRALRADRGVQPGAEASTERSLHKWAVSGGGRAAAARARGVPGTCPGSAMRPRGRAPRATTALLGVVQMAEGSAEGGTTGPVAPAEPATGSEGPNRGDPSEIHSCLRRTLG